MASSHAATETGRHRMLAAIALPEGEEEEEEDEEIEKKQMPLPLFNPAWSATAGTAGRPFEVTIL